MKLNCTPIGAPAGGQAPRAAPSRGEGRPRTEARDSRDAFERALRDKALPPATGEPGAPPPDTGLPMLGSRGTGSSCDEQGKASSDAALPVGGTPLMAWVGLPMVRASDAPPPSPVGIETATGTRAAIETALRQAEPPTGPLAGPDRPAVWEASIGGPHGTVEVRAERLVVHGAPPSWGLTIGAPAFPADLASRHAGRLHERLRKHGIDVDHVRIERRRDRDDPPR